MECQCIAAKIPFMKIETLKKGGQSKIHGPCVNVPASMEPIAEMLPRIHENLKLVVVQLKHRLTYKSYYMSDYIRPELMWEVLLELKAKHPLYKDIKVNHHWFDQLHDCTVPSQNKEEQQRVLEDQVFTQLCNQKTTETFPDQPTETDPTIDNTIDNDAEHEQEQKAQTQRSELTAEPLPTCLQINDIDQTIFSIAPGQNSVPQLILTNPDFK